MSTVDYIIIGVILAISGLSLWYILREKKKGKKCIGCSCNGDCAGGCGIHK